MKIMVADKMDMMDIMKGLYCSRERAPNWK
jgi:hypothetical protein